MLDQLAGRHELPPSAVPELRKVYTSLQPIAEWSLLGPLPIDARLPVSPEGPIDRSAPHTGAKGEPRFACSTAAR